MWHYVESPPRGEGSPPSAREGLPPPEPEARPARPEVRNEKLEPVVPTAKQVQVARRAMEVKARHAKAKHPGQQKAYARTGRAWVRARVDRERCRLLTQAVRAQLRQGRQDRARGQVAGYAVSPSPDEDELQKIASDQHKRRETHRAGGVALGRRPPLARCSRSSRALCSHPYPVCCPQANTDLCSKPQLALSVRSSRALGCRPITPRAIPEGAIGSADPLLRCSCRG